MNLLIEKYFNFPRPIAGLKQGVVMFYKKLMKPYFFE